jgi:aspartate aminotransferase
VPGFPIYESQIVANGAVPVGLPLRESRGFAFDPDELGPRITPKTRLLILNTPHNPTGGLLTRADLEAIAEVLRRHPQVWVYADEIYSKLVYDGEFVSIATLPGMRERTIISDGASKTYAMTGWRIGFTANARWRRCSRAGSPTPSRAPRRSASGRRSRRSTGPQDEADRMRRALPPPRDLIVRLLNEVPGFSCASPGGAFYAWPNVTEACARIGAGLGGAAQGPAARGRRRGAGRHPLRPARARRWPAHPLLLRGERGGDRAGVRRIDTYIRKAQR